MAHCGNTTEGQYINTLTCVDLSSGWVECLVVRQRTQEAVFEAIQSMRTRLPFSLLCIEQKNWSVVRRLIGYDRFETETEQNLLKIVYENLRLYTNFFQPVLKLVFKELVDKKLIKRYDQAATPFQRILAAKDIFIEAKAPLRTCISNSILFD